MFAHARRGTSAGIIGKITSKFVRRSVPARAAGAVRRVGEEACRPALSRGVSPKGSQEMPESGSVAEIGRKSNGKHAKSLSLTEKKKGRVRISKFYKIGQEEQKFEVQR